MTNTFKVGDKVRVNNTFPKEYDNPPQEDIAKRGVEAIVRGFDAEYVRLEGHGLFYPSELDLIPVRKFKAGERVYVPQPPYEGVHTIFQVLKDSEPESEFDYTLDRDWTKAVYESEIEALPTEFKKGEWVKVLEIPEEYSWWTENYGVTVGSIHRVHDEWSIDQKDPQGGVYGLTEPNGPTVIKVDAPVSEPEKNAAAFVVGDRVRPNLAEKHNAQGWYENYSEGTVVGVGEDIQVRHDHVTFDGGINGFVANWIPEALIKSEEAAEPTKQEKVDAALKALEDAQNAVDNAANVLSAASDQLDEATLDYWRAVIAVQALENGESE